MLFTIKKISKPLAVRCDEIVIPEVRGIREEPNE